VEEGQLLVARVLRSSEAVVTTPTNGYLEWTNGNTSELSFIEVAVTS